MTFPLESFSGIPINLHPGAFGFKRSFYIHPGVDLYCEPETLVYAMEDGLVTGVGGFTGPSVGSHWWNETEYVMVAGESGTICYGEIEPSVKVGDKIKEGDIIGKVIPVFPEEKIKTDVMGHSNYMLHIELYKGVLEEPLEWLLGESRPDSLLDITPLLMKCTKELKILI